MIRSEHLVILASVLALGSEAIAQQDKYQPEIPAATVARMEEARALRRDRNAPESVRLLREVVQARPDYYLAQYNLGIALADGRDYAGAIQAFDRAVAIKEARSIPDASVYNSAGWANLLARDYRKAEALLRKADTNRAQLSEESAKRLDNNLGLLYLYKGDLGASARYLQAAEAQGSALAKENLKLLEGVRAVQRQPAPK